MAIEYLRQANWTNGELDPHMLGRRDVKAYHASLAAAENLLITPQGPLFRRPGLDHIARLRRALEEVPASTVHMTAPNGGDVADIGSTGIATTVAMGTTNPYVVLTIDLVTAQRVDLVDLIDFGATDATDPAAAPLGFPWALENHETAVAVQYQVGADWLDFGLPFSLGTFLRTRRAGLGPRQGVTARQWRVVKIGDHDWDADTFKLKSVRFWKETEDVSPAQARRFFFDAEDQRYVMVATAGNIEVYHADGRVASIPTPYTANHVGSVTRAQVLDTEIRWHVDVAPQKITRQGAHGEWDIRDAVFENVPLFDYTGEALNGVDDVQQLHFTDYANADTFNITLEDETTTAIVYSTVGATAAASIKAALENLPNVGPNGVNVVNTAAGVFSVTFVGKSANSDVGEMAPLTLSSTAGGVTAATLTQGKSGGEPIFSATRGYPACGVFYQSRLWQAGLKSRPQTLIGSRLTSYFDLETKGAKSDAAISIDLDTDELTAIRAMYAGRHLQVFTSTAEFYFPTEPIVPIPAVKQATRRGIAASTPIAEMDGATIFVTYGGEAAAQFVYDDNQQSYTADHLTVLHSHLFKGVVDFAFRRARSTDRPDMGLFVRSDGKMAVMTALVSQDVTGFVTWSTAGNFVSAVADTQGDSYVIVERTDASGTDYRLEKFTSDGFLDAAVRLEAGDPIEVVEGLDHLEGLTVSLYVDDSYDGEAVVEGGQVTLPNAALRNVQIGLNFTPHGVLLPFVLENDPRAGLGVSARVGEINFRLGPTGNLSAGIKGGRMWAVPLKRRPATPLDEGTGNPAFEGLTRLYGVPGFRSEGQIEFIQYKPGPLCIQEIIAVVST